MTDAELTQLELRALVRLMEEISPVEGIKSSSPLFDVVRTLWYCNRYRRGKPPADILLDWAVTYLNYESPRPLNPK